MRPEPTCNSSIRHTTRIVLQKDVSEDVSEIRARMLKVWGRDSDEQCIRRLFDINAWRRGDSRIFIAMREGYPLGNVLLVLSLTFAILYHRPLLRFLDADVELYFSQTFACVSYVRGGHAETAFMDAHAKSLTTMRLFVVESVFLLSSVLWHKSAVLWTRKEAHFRFPTD